VYSQPDRKTLGGFTVGVPGGVTGVVPGLVQGPRNTPPGGTSKKVILRSGECSGECVPPRTNPGTRSRTPTVKPPIHHRQAPGMSASRQRRHLPTFTVPG
jgi:hypothetical protein